MSRTSKRIYRLYQAKKESGFQEVLFIPRGVAFRNPDLLPCRCGEMPLIQQSVYAEHPCWIIRCPECDRRAASEGSYDRVRQDWNTGHYSPDTAIVATPLIGIDTDGLIALIKALAHLEQRERKKVRRESLREAV